MPLPPSVTAAAGAIGLFESVVVAVVGMSPSIVLRSVCNVMVVSLNVLTSCRSLGFSSSLFVFRPNPQTLGLCRWCDFRDIRFLLCSSARSKAAKMSEDERCWLRPNQRPKRRKRIETTTVLALVLYQVFGAETGPKLCHSRSCNCIIETFIRNSELNFHESSSMGACMPSSYPKPRITPL